MDEGDRRVGRRAALSAGRLGPTDRPSIPVTRLASVSSDVATGPDDPAVAQDRDGVGQVEDLAQEVRDEDDRATPRAQAADDLVEPFDLRRRQARRRLVEDDEVGVAGERAQDLDLLLLRDRQAADRPSRRRGRSRRPRPVDRTARGATAGR